MKIAFALINCNRSDGSARAALEVAERLVRRGHEVWMIARTTRDLTPGLLKVTRIPGVSWPEVADFVSYWHLANRFFSNRRFDVVHAIGPNTRHADFVTIQNIQPSKRKHLAEAERWERVSPARKFTRRLYLLATSRAERLLYERAPNRPVLLPVSHGVSKELHAHYAIGNATVKIIPNAADTETFRPLKPDQRAALRGTLGWPLSTPVLLFVGGEWKRKGLDLAISALAKSSNTTWKLAVAGSDPAQSGFVNLATQLGVRHRVHFLGFRKDVPEIMAAADAFLFPSHYEAFSLATLEAASAGLPLIASRINGTEELIKPGFNGIFIPHDPSYIATEIDTLLENPHTLPQLGAAARQTVLDSYTWDRVTQATETAYLENL